MSFYSRNLGQSSGGVASDPRLFPDLRKEAKRKRKERRRGDGDAFLG
ncbi:MAG: hypothetical protein QXO94_07700 [Candidatus Bathyarchaeia archaeon]